MLMERANPIPPATLPHHEVRGASIHQTASRSRKSDDYYNRESHNASVRIFLVSVISILVTFALYGVYALMKRFGLAGEVPEWVWLISGILASAIVYVMLPRCLDVLLRKAE
jgi:hypothetical protein